MTNPSTGNHSSPKPRTPDEEDGVTQPSSDCTPCRYVWGLGGLKCCDRRHGRQLCRSNRHHRHDVDLYQCIRVSKFTNANSGPSGIGRPHVSVFDVEYQVKVSAEFANVIRGQLHHVLPPDSRHSERFGDRFECGYKMGFQVVRDVRGRNTRNKDRGTDSDDGSEMELLDVIGLLLNAEVLDIHVQPLGPLAITCYALTRP
jgi:hypothetical protein